MQSFGFVEYVQSHFDEHSDFDGSFPPLLLDESSSVSRMIGRGYIFDIVPVLARVAWCSDIARASRLR